jgi:hypothetical protein
MKKKSHERTAKRRPDIHDHAKNRACYLIGYQHVRDILAQGATVEQARRVHRLAHELNPIDPAVLSQLDEYERENLDSIEARALEDALAGKPPCPIWGDFNLDTPQKRRTKRNGRRKDDPGPGRGGRV